MPFHFDSLQLKSLLLVKETGSFTKAAQMVGRTQSAVSLQIKSLEDALGCQLFDRRKQKVMLTQEGELFCSYAARIVELQREAYSRLKEPDVEGEIRFGTPEDFATHYLPHVLALFRKQHPFVQLSVSCDLTLNLLDQFRSGRLDVILIKRDRHVIKEGLKVWREPLVWAAHESFPIENYLSKCSQRALPLILAPEPCIYRTAALQALHRANITYYISYTSQSLAGNIAAVNAGLGVTILPAHMLPAGIHPVSSKGVKLPKLQDTEIVLLQRPNLSKAGEILISHIKQMLENSNRPLA